MTIQTQDKADPLLEQLKAVIGVEKAVKASPDALRKALLEVTESGKKTPAPTEKAGPDGNVKPDPFDEMVKAKFGVA